MAEVISNTSPLLERIAPLVDQLEQAGMRISSSIRLRVLVLAGESQ